MPARGYSTGVAMLFFNKYFLINRFAQAGLAGKNMKLDNTLKPPEWRNSTTICAFADGERHYGHIVKIDGRWYAFDATHPDAEGAGFRRLGSFAGVRSAKQSVERSTLDFPMPLAGVA